jgi:DDE superfamily endonuclease
MKDNPGLKNEMRLSIRSFYKLLGLIEEDLKVDEKKACGRGGPVLPDLCLYMTLRYLAGSDIPAIKNFTGVSRAAAYRAVGRTLKAIVNCKPLAPHFPRTKEECASAALEFRSISWKGAIKNCVGAIDGYLLSINLPPPTDTANVTGFFSGHYQRYGINVQACCDSQCHFTFFALSAPGSWNDRIAVKVKDVNGVSLSGLVESLPSPYVCIADAAYEPTESMIPLYYGEHRRDPLYDNFNFYASQCRIQIEMSFGMMTQKWRILLRPIMQKFKNVQYIALAIARLHNFCINDRLEQGKWNPVTRSAAIGTRDQAISDENKSANGFIPQTDVDADARRFQYVTGGSFMRQTMSERAHHKKLMRPLTSVLHRNHVAIVST